MRISDWSSDVCSSDLYAHIAGWCPHEAALRSVRKGLPRQPPDTNHFVAISYAEVPGFIERLAALPAAAGRDTLLFTICTAVRSGETLLAVWPDFNLKNVVWSIRSEENTSELQSLIRIQYSVFLC